MDLTQVVKVHGSAKIGSSISDVLGGTVLNLGEWDLADFDAMAIVSDTTLPTATTDANVLSSAAIANPAEGATSWTPDRSLILDLPADGNVYLAASIGHGINIYSIELIPIEAPNA